MTARAPAGQSQDDVQFGALSGSLGFLLRLSQIQSFADFYDGLGGLDIRPGEFSTLLMLDENPGIRQGVLAKALMIKRAHMAKMVRIMEEHGHVSRTVPQSDRRAVELWLTPQGKAKLDTVKGAFLRHEARVSGGLNETEHWQLMQLLKKYLGHPPCPSAKDKDR